MALDTSIASKGKRDNPKPRTYICHGRTVSSNAMRAGVNITIATSDMDAKAAQLSLWLVKGPILNSEWSERTLNA